MKKTIVISCILLGFFLSGAGAAAALEVAWPNSPLGTSLNEDTDVASLIQYLYEWGISLGGFAAFIILVIAGFQYLTSVGDPAKMKSARDRIKDAALGLILLLGSVLILNTINPQLTQLKVPQFSTEPGEWQIDLKLGDKLKEEKTSCVAARFYSGSDYQTEVLKVSGENPNFNVEIKSVKFDGKCQLTLYRLKDYQTNSDNPPVVISGNVSNMAAYGETRFRSAKVIHF